MFRDFKFNIMHRLGEKEWACLPADRIELSPQLQAIDKEGVIYKIDWENTYLLQSTEKFDKVGSLIFQSSVLKKGEFYYEVVYGSASFFAIRSLGDDTQPDVQELTEKFCIDCEVVGDAFRNGDLIQKAVDEAVFNSKIKTNENN